MKIINIFWNTFNDINYATFIEVFGPKLESDRMCSIDFIEVFGPKLKSDHMCSIDFIEVFGPKLKSDRMCSIDFIEVFGPKLESDRLCSIDFINIPTVWYFWRVGGSLLQSVFVLKDMIILCYKCNTA